MDGTFDIDRWSGDFIGQHADTVAGPLASTLRQEELAINNQGQFVVPAESYAPLIWIAPKSDLGNEVIRVEVTQVAPGPDKRQDGVKFAPYSERDGYLPYLSPATGAGDKTNAETAYRLVVRIGSKVIPLRQVKAVVKVRVTNGRFAKLMAFTQVETLRVRRLAREAAARRSLAGATGHGLDRIGRELAVPRLDDRIEIRNGEMLIRQQRERDGAYRRRLGIYRPFSMPTRTAVLDRLNSPHSAMRQAGFDANFDVLETDNPFMIGFKIVAVGETEADATRARLNYLDYVRKTVLIDVTNDVPPSRHLPQVQRVQEQAMRRRVRSIVIFKRGIEPSIAPWLAVAFDRLARLWTHMRLRTAKFIIQQAQSDRSDSRFELGLAAIIKTPTRNQVRAFRNGITNARMPTNDPELAGLLATLKAANKQSDTGDWLFHACGFRTYETVRTGQVLVSHASFGPLNISGPDAMSKAQARAGEGLHARLNNNNGSAADLALKNALGEMEQNWPDDVDEGTILNQSQTTTAFQNMDAVDFDIAPVLQAIGQTPPARIGDFVTAMKVYPRHVFRIVTFNHSLLGILKGPTDEAANVLGQIADALGSNGASSMAFVSVSGNLAMIVSSIGLPQVGTNLGPRRSSDFFWNAQAISTPNGEGRVRLSGQGTRALLKVEKEGVYAVTCLAYSRIGKTDPFEWRITLPRDATLTYPQYELLMNMLSRMFPLGVEINTWDIRRHNVALDGETQKALSPRLSRSYRPFKRPRFHGTGDTPVLSPRT